MSLSEQRYNRKLFLQIPISSISQDLMNPPKLPRFPSSNVFVAVLEGSWTQTPRVGQLQHFWDRKCFGVPCHVLLDFENFDILGLRFLSQRCLEQRSLVLCRSKFRLLVRSLFSDFNTARFKRNSDGSSSHDSATSCIVKLLRLAPTQKSVGQLCLLCFLEIYSNTAMYYSRLLQYHTELQCTSP